jgi:hypothetical protein
VLKYGFANDDSVRVPIRASLTCVLLATALLVGCGGNDDSELASQPAVTGPLDEEGSDLFVLRGPAEVADGRIELTTDVVEWFNDRPQRSAGVSEASELVENWNEYGFENVPPNAAAAGEESDSAVELTKPEITDEGISFAYKPLRGEISSEEAGMSVFIDSSEWDTDMHVYVEDQGYCGSSTMTLTNLDVLTWPAAWGMGPPDSYTMTGSYVELFNAANPLGPTKFSVQYDIECGGQNEGTVVFKGDVPNNYADTNSFSCTRSGTPSGKHCSASHETGFHVDAHAKFYE